MERNPYETRRMRALASFAHGASILDVGCSDSPNPYLRGQRVVGLDTKPMEIGYPYTEHIIGDALFVSDLLPERKFDAIVLGEMIEHVERPYDLLRALRASLAPEGKLVLSTPNPLGLPPVIAEYFLLRRFFYSTEHLFYFPPRWVWRLLESSGYVTETTVGCGISLFGRWLPAPITLSYQVIYVARPTAPGK